MAERFQSTADQSPDWRELLRDARDLPAWLPRIALADVVTRELLIIGEESSGATCIPGGSTALLARLEAGGAFVESESGDARGQYRLRPEVLTAMLADVQRDDPDLSRTREDLVHGGLARHYPTLAVQIAKWAYEGRDWATLEHLWGTYSAGILLADRRVRSAYAEAPDARRAHLPGLSYGLALAAAFNPTTGNIDLNDMATSMIRDGRTLHARWSTNATAEAKMSAGTLWMLAQATLPEALTDPCLDGSNSTAAELIAMAAEASVAGDAVSSKTLTFFHATASLVGFLRTDWARSRRESELAMILGECGFAGFLACLMAAMSSSASGNTQYFSLAEKYLARHAEHQCRVATWIEPAFHLPWADAANRSLDKVLAQRHLRMHEIEGSATSRFHLQPMHALVTATSGILWDDPERALAEFDALVSEGAIQLESQEPWGPLLLRWRAELLMAMGENQRADHLLATLLDHSPAVTAVPSARLHLWSGDYGRAVAKADEGIFSLELSLADRAHLYAIKSAALLLGGAADDLVASAAAGACVVSEQAHTLVPFAMLPSGVRTRLVELHHAHHPVADCLFGSAGSRGAFDQLPAGRTPTSNRLRLTRREAVLLPLLATHATVQEIADQQFVSVNTVRKQVVALREKFGVSNRTDLIARAQETGLLNA